MAMERERDFSQMLPLKSMLKGGSYKVERYISSGGFGNTYEITSMAFGERMALKEFFMRGISERDGNTRTVNVSNIHNQATFDSQKNKFKKEAKRLRDLNNEHIVRVHDRFEENGTEYYVMDYIDGESLSECLSRLKKPLSESDVLDVLEQMLDALEAVHSLENPIYHLDIKPANIIIGKRGKVTLIDFGASKQIDKSGDFDKTTTVIPYTDGYAPNEQIEQKLYLIGAWTDLYALGATLYKLLTNINPPSTSEMLRDDAFNYPSGVSEKTKYLVRWMMSPNLKDRPKSVADIRKFLSDEFTEIKPDPKSIPKPNYNQETDLYIKRDNTPQPKPTPFPFIKPILLGVGSALLMVILFKLFNGCDGPGAIPPPKPVIITVVDSLVSSSLGDYSYTGPVDSIFQPHGRGVAKFTSNGRQFEAFFEHGNMRNDSVIVTGLPDDMTFEGTIVDGKCKEGVLTYKLGGYFDGIVEDDGKEIKVFTGTYTNKKGMTSQWIKGEPQ